MKKYMRYYKAYISYFTKKYTNTEITKKNGLKQKKSCFFLFIEKKLFFANPDCSDYKVTISVPLNFTTFLQELL